MRILSPIQTSLIWVILKIAPKNDHHKWGFFIFVFLGTIFIFYHLDRVLNVSLSLKCFDSINLLLREKVSNFQASFKKRYKVLRVNLQYIKEICPFLNVYRNNSLLGILKSPQNCNAYKWILRCVTRCSRIDHHNY